MKLGPEGVAGALHAGVNDLGGTLMNESISRSAGSEHGQEMAPEERRLASFGAAPLVEPRNPSVKDARLVAPARLIRPGFATSRA